MARKRVRSKPSPTKTPVKGRQPEHTAEFWKNSYEMSQQSVRAMKVKLADAYAEIERLTKRTTSIESESGVVSRPVRKRVRVKHQTPTT